MNTTTGNNLAPLFRSFEWVGESAKADTGRYVMLSNIRDLASGVALALQLAERSDLQQENGDAPLIDAAASRRFTRMSIAAMNVIEGYIDEHFDDMNDRAAARRNTVTKQNEPGAAA